MNALAKKWAQPCLTLMLICLSGEPLLADDANQENLKIGDGSEWMYVAGTWSDTPEGGIAGSRNGDGQGLQGYSFAFNKAQAFADLEAEFTIQMPANHADIGLVVRAQDPTHYYLIHFPQCGQAYRAQHFWAAVSKADGSGYLRILKLAHVQRVASNPFGIAHKARVKVTGDRISVWVNGYPAIDVRDDTYRSGRIGLAGFNQFAHAKVTVRGTPAEAEPWNDKIEQVQNWFVPFPQIAGQQGQISLARASGGDLLCLFSSGDNQRYLARSKDKGRTWQVGDVPQNLNAALLPEKYYFGDIHDLKDGRLIGVSLESKGGFWTHSTDQGESWSKPEAISVEGWPTEPKTLHTGYQLALADGTLIRFGLGRASTDSEPITKWGTTHVQAFSTRSTDGGRNWSVPVNLDTNRPEMGNLDLTEPVAFEASDGRIMCLIRPVYSPWMWETWSHDKGVSWGPCVRGPFPGYAPSPMLKTQSGAAMIATRFPGLAIHTTPDDGMTWDEGTYIDTSIWAMGDMIEIEPDLFLFVYMDSFNGAARAQFVRVTPDGLVPAREMLPD